MKIQYLGTAAAEGWPSVFCDCEWCRKALRLAGKNIRTRSQVVIDDTLLVDMPPDAYFHSLCGDVSFSHIVTVLVTHSHQDHFYPAEFVMRGEPYAHVSAVPVLSVYGNKKVHSFYDAAMVYDDTTNLNDRVYFQEVTEFTAFVTNDGYTVTPVPATHDRNENCLLYLIEKGGKTLFYANDSGLFPESTWEFLKGKHLDLINLDCTCILEKDGKNHMGLPDNIEAKERLYALGCADKTTKFILTHFSHNYKLMHAEIEDAVCKYGFIPAFDGMELEI